MSNLSKVIRVVLTTLVLVVLTAATYFAYVKFTAKPSEEPQSSLVVLNGQVTQIADGFYIVEANQKSYNLYIDKYSYVALADSHPQNDSLIQGYMGQANVTALEALKVGSEVQVTGNIDGTSDDFIVKNLHILN